MRILILVLIHFLSCLLLSGCSDPKEDYKIGAILVLSDQSGAEYINEHDFLKGMEVAVKKINNKGGIKGRKVSLLIRDCQKKSQLAREQILELLDHDPVAIISIYSHIAKALTGIASSQKFTHIAALSSAENIFKNSTHSFRYGPWASIEVKAALPIIQKLNAHKIALVNINNIYGNSASDQLAELANSEGVATQKIVYKTIDDELMNKLQRLENIDLIYFTCFPEDISNLLKMFRKVYPDLPIVAPNMAASPKFTRRPELEGVYLAAPLIYNSGFHFIFDTNKFFTEQTGEKLNHYSAIGYDVINLLSQFIQRSEESPPELTKDLREGFIYPGLFGDVVNEAGSNEFSFPLYPARIQNGSVVYQER